MAPEKSRKPKAGSKAAYPTEPERREPFDNTDTTPSRPSGAIVPEPAVESGSVTARAPIGLVDAPRDVIFVHGVQWIRDYELRGYSRPTQDLMKNQAPTVQFRFHEVLWSDVVEPDEQTLIAGIGVIADIIKQNYVGAAFDLFKLIGQRTDFQVQSPKEAFETPLPALIAGKGGFIDKALSAILDIAFYLSDTYGPRIRAKVQEALAQARPDPPPILFGHSLGSVIILDVIRENIRAGRAGGFVSAGSPIGLFQPDRDREEFSALDWVNFYDSDDIVGFWNPLRRKGYGSVMDQRIDTHELPFYSHVKYWTNSVVARELVDKSLTA